MNRQVLQIPRTTCPFLQKDNMNQFQKTMKAPALPVPTTIFLLTSMSTRILLLLLLQIPVTIFLNTSTFMQNSQLFNIHPSLLHPNCRGR